MEAKYIVKFTEGERASVFSALQRLQSPWVPSEIKGRFPGALKALKEAKLESLPEVDPGPAHENGDLFDDTPAYAEIERQRGNLNERLYQVLASFGWHPEDPDDQEIAFGEIVAAVEITDGDPKIVSELISTIETILSREDIRPERQEIDRAIRKAFEPLGPEVEDDEPIDHEEIANKLFRVLLIVGWQSAGVRDSEMVLDALEEKVKTLDFKAKDPCTAIVEPVIQEFLEIGWEPSFLVGVREAKRLICGTLDLPEPTPEPEDIETPKGSSLTRLLNMLTGQK